MSCDARKLAAVAAGGFVLLSIDLAVSAGGVLAAVGLAAVLGVAGLSAFASGPRLPRVAFAATTLVALLIYVPNGEPTSLPPLVPLLVAALATALVGALISDDRATGLLVGAALAAFEIAVVLVVSDPPSRFPSLPSLGFLAFYPLMLAALVLALRRRLPGARATVWLDIAIGGLAVATITDFIVLRPVLDEHQTVAAIGAHVNALGDYLLLGTVAAALVISGGHLGRRMLVLACALGLLTIADTDFVFVLVGREEPTHLSLMCWSVALVLVAWAPWVPTTVLSRSRSSRLGVVVPALAVPLVVVPLVFGDLHDGPASEIADTAGALIVLCLVGVRLLLTLRDNGRLLANAHAARSRTTAVLDSAGEGIVGLDPDGVVTFANTTALSMVGASDADVIGRPWEQAIQARTDLLALAIGDTLLEGTAHPPVDMTLIAAGGWELAVQCTATPIELDGGVAGAVITITDVSERRAAEEAVRRSEEHLVHAQRLAGLGSWEWDARSERVHWSDEQVRIHGISAAHVPHTEHAFYEVILDDDREAVKTAFDASWDSGEPVDVTYRVPTPDGMRLIHLTGEVLLDADGVRSGVFGTSQDVTDRLRREEAERASRAKSEFLSRMSHELRTPLNAILGFGQLLEMSTLSAKQEANVSQILAAGTHLLGLIDEVLDISRIEAGRLSMSVEPVDLTETVREVAQLTAPLAAERGIEVELDLPAEGAWANADGQRLRQVVLNLVANGIKYNSDGGDLRLAIGVRDGLVHLDVSDSGMGIASEDLCRLFTAFERLGNDGGFVEGTGLGLAVTKGLIDAMGGTIDVSSTVGLGSTFHIALPGAEMPSLADAARGAEALGTAPDVTERAASCSEPIHRLLCIEDNDSNFALVQGILGGRGDVELLGAPDAASGLASIRTSPPDAVLLDLNLPDRHGAEVLRELRADPTTATLPVVVLSADATAERMRDVLAAGADAYLTKPLDVIELLMTVEDVLSRAT